MTPENSGGSGAAPPPTPKRKMPEGKRFVKGAPSANPGGRPKLAPEVKEAFRALTVEAIEQGRKLLHSRNEAVRARIVEAVLRKGIPDGLSVEVSGPEGAPLPATPLRLAVATDEELGVLRALALRSRGPNGSNG